MRAINRPRATTWAGGVPVALCGAVVRRNRILTGEVAGVMATALRFEIRDTMRGG